MYAPIGASYTYLKLPLHEFKVSNFTLDPKFHEVSLNIRKGIEAKNYDETVRKYKKSPKAKTLPPKTCSI